MSEEMTVYFEDMRAFLEPEEYEKFLKYLHNLRRLGLLELSGKEAPLPERHGGSLRFKIGATVNYVPGTRRYYRITQSGIEDSDSWANPIKALGYQ